MTQAVLKKLPNTGFAPSNASIAAHLRDQADWIEEAEDGVRNVFLVVERADGSVYRQSAGQPCDLARSVGVVVMALIRDSLGMD